MEDEFLLRWGDLDVEILDRTNGVLQVRVPTNATTGPLTWVDASGVTSLAGRRVVAAPSTIEVLSTANGGNGISLRDGAVAKTDSGNHLVRNGTGLRLRGTATTHCRVAGNSIVQNAIGLSLEDSSQRHRIGGENTFGDNAVGIRVDHSSNHRIDRNVVRDNANQGILLTGGATNVLVLDNLITRNAIGVEISGPRTLAHRILLNSITASLGKGIRLHDGGNREIPPPFVESDGSQRVFGTAVAEDGSKIELFSDRADEGAKFLGAAPVVRGRWHLDLDLHPASVGRRFQLHATVTDIERNTSEFGDVEGSGSIAPLLFVSTRDGNAELYRLDGPWSEPVRLTSHAAEDRSPAPAPSGETAAFVSDRDGNREIHLLSLNGTDSITRLTTHPAADHDPAWRSDGAALIFVSEKEGHPDLYTITATGTEVVRLTSDTSEERWPSYSPEGGRVCFASNRGGSWAVWLMNSNGSELRPLASTSANDTPPRWSPGGSWIAFVSDRDGNPEIYVARPDGSEVRRLTHHPAVDAEPAWPDDGTLVFTSHRDGGFELYQINILGDSTYRLMVSSGENREPGTAR